MACSLLRVLDLILHPVASSFDHHGFSVVQEAVQHGRCQRRVIVEDLRPGFVRLVGRQDERSLLVALADHLEEQVCADLVDGKIPQLVN